MNELKRYQPYWPETVIFWGAGATQPLKMKLTHELGRTFQILAEAFDHGAAQTDDQRLESAIKEAIPKATDQIKKEFKALIVLIDSRYRSQRGEAMRVLGFQERRAEHLQRLYDWEAVQKVIERCPRNHDQQFSLKDLYNLLDMHIKSQNGIEVERQFITLDRLIAARRTVDMMTQLVHAVGFHELLHNQDLLETYDQYNQFAKILADLMNEEGQGRMLRSPCNLNDRRYYLFSYAIISMNWDPLLLWLILNAHQAVNQKAVHSPQSVKLFNDLVHFMAIRKVDGQTPAAWFPMNETAVQHLNGQDGVTSRRVRIGKFYFPHGCFGFRQCPKCGKLTFYLGDTWDVRSTSLFPPQILPSLSPRRPRSFEEKKAMDEGVYDAVQCAHCGTITETHHTPITMQTNFKGRKPSFIQEIQSDMKVAIENARHIIFAGYSLPEDDFVYRSILSARRRMENDKVKCSVIGVDPAAPDGWMCGPELRDYLNARSDSSLAGICRRVADIFGEENVRASGAGFPNVFLKNGSAGKEKVKEMLRVWL
ncbi:hypothetical protein [Sporolactobacillus pectinivorans]|uniref:hypothetical protein n=1 Tax=Sporolactobacillus pectinivorans TaxID=1591408 RepID=UPI000C263A2E|nr:hypothetical protein [Sporolactobacillus pectinivorans]